ncbi:hypothetical protein PGT21_019321 [Puccinia graminis f. sp. tritici]|uniref:Oligopeptide transporter n=1 Tax=Puccinia graminis f. sp. tritici TaxID=56615 RepID=A0A5B0PAG7_PUCGR|nr:hypothetical protein PGT21_019321 [Puccinia graminis f. sp. tritici]KAA1125998.1 hypothetical protein PGTUg99_009511 [Puccinia graminis f. sp. tritici]
MATDTETPAGARKRTVPRPDQPDEDNSLAHYPPKDNLLLRESTHEMHYSTFNTTSLTSYLDQVCQKNKEHEKISAIQESCIEAVGGKDPNTSDPFDETAVIPDVEEGDDNPNMPTVTVRSCLVGLIMAIFGAAVSQIFMYKPVHLHPHPLFIQLACLILGRAFAKIPGPLWWNPCPLTVKETVFAAIMATAGAAGTPSVEMVATQDLFFDRKMHPAIIIMTLLSSQLIGYGWAGLLRPFLIYPAKTIFPSVLPSVALFKSLGQYTPDVEKQVKSFKKVFIWTSLYEVIPMYLAPALQAISPWCLTLPQVPAITNIFGGSMVAEGMGLFAFSSDWMLVGSHGPLFVPLMAQITDWVSVSFAIFLMGAAYRFNWFGGPPLPFISYDILDSHGKRYNLTTTIHKNGTENFHGVEALGLPYYAPTYIVGKTGVSLAVTSAITGALIWNWEETKAAFRKGDNPGTEDPHRTITKKYAQFPEWAFCLLAVLFVGLAFLCSYLGKSGLSVVALLTAFCISAVLSLAAGFFYATVGVGLHCHPVVQMLGGLMFPGNAIANMWFTLFGSTSVGQSVFMLRDLKLGQYMHLSSLSVVCSQLTGTLVGGFTHYFVMIAILSSQRDVLLLPNGNGVFTGMALSTFAAESTTWGVFSRKLYLTGQRYAVVPYSLIVGFFLPIPFFLLHRWKPHYGFNKVNISLFCSGFFGAIGGVTSARTVGTMIAIYTQYYIRKYRFQWYQKYNYILSAALDGGTQFMMFILTLTLQGGAGFKVEMPTYFLNPKGTRDYCYLPSAKK